MKKCPKCGEGYADTTIKCNDCDIVLPTNKVASKTKKICPKCGNIYIGKNKCPDCDTVLSENLDMYSPVEYSYESYGPGLFLYILAVLIPLVGFIIGVAYITGGNEDKGKPLIITSIITVFVCLIIWLMISL